MAEYDILVECQVIIEANNEEEAENIAIKNIQNCLNPYYIEAYAEGQTVKRGEWKYYKNTGIFDIHKCSVCTTPFELPMDIVPSSVFCFCPHCGARMDGGAKND